MLKRELIRILALAILGIILGALLGFPPGSRLFIAAPLYAVGLFYSGRSFLHLLGKLLSTYAQYQMMSLMFRSLFAALLCVVLLAVGLAVLCTIGWLLGLVRCLAALISAAQLDRSFRTSAEEWNFR